jgi:hypothetical protein
MATSLHRTIFLFLVTTVDAFHLGDPSSRNHLRDNARLFSTVESSASLVKEVEHSKVRYRSTHDSTTLIESHLGHVSLLALI